MRYVFWMIFIVIGSKTIAQPQAYSHHSSWNAVTVKASLNDSFFLKSEFNFRRTHFMKDWEQIVLRPSLQYKINEALTAAVGFTYAYNYAYSDFSAPLDNQELNLWQQLFIRQPHQRFTLSHRLRFEERFRDAIHIKNGIPTIHGTDYGNRLRYRFILSVPLHFKPSVSILVYNEVFLDFRKSLQPQRLDQNWYFAGFRLFENEQVSITTGYHHIYATGGDRTIANHIWETILVYLIE